MLLSAEQLLLQDSTHLTAAQGDQSLFLAPDEASMRWFLLPSDHLPRGDKQAAMPPFTPRLYPLPLSRSREPVAQHEEGGARNGRGEGVSGSCAAEGMKAECVRFHSPPKSIFRPAVEVCSPAVRCGWVCVCSGVLWLGICVLWLGMCVLWLGHVSPVGN